MSCQLSVFQLPTDRPELELVQGISGGGELQHGFDSVDRAALTDFLSDLDKSQNSFTLYLLSRYF